MNIKQILSSVFYLVCFIESSTAVCNPYSFFGESQDCGVPEERGDELFARPKLYRLSNLQLYIIFLLLLFFYCSVRLLLLYEQKKEEEQNTERSCTCPITQTSPDITETEKLSWEPASTCGVPESENKTKLALEEEWDNLERTRSNNYEERMRRTDEYLRALRSQVQQLSDFSKEHGNPDSLNSPNGRPSRSAENVSRTNFDPPCTRIHGMPPMIKPLIKSNHVHCAPKRMPSPPARAAGFPRNQEVKLPFPPCYQNQMRTAQSPRIVPGIQAPVTTWCSMQGRTSRRDMRQWSQEGSPGTPRGSPQCYPTSLRIGGTRRRCLCENTSPRETNIICSVCRKKHLS